MNDTISKHDSTPLFVRNRPLLEATFLARPNRFVAIVRINREDGLPEPYQADGTATSGAEGGEVQAHVADPGRLEELLVPGRKVYLLPAQNGGSRPRKARGAKRKRRVEHQRKTAYTLVLVDYEGTLVSIDSRVPNELVYDGLSKGFFPELSAYHGIKREAGFGESRLDFRLSANACPSGDLKPQNKDSIVDIPDCLIEVKSVSLVRDTRSLFPDAPTIRGARHMRELKDAVSAGLKASVIFVIQREDARSFSPNDAMDPKFGVALREAVRSGVDVWAYTCRVSKESIALNRQVPVVL
jgi:sugar fermentation stimulation protein A